jgi:hypothetical protein
MQESSLAHQSSAELEYTTLREEQVKRTESRTQWLSITLTLGGAFLGVGWGQSAVALLLYPPLAALLAAGWAQNEVRIHQISRYIHEHLEKRIPGMGWERYSRGLDDQTQSTGWLLELFSVGGIFLITQLLAIFLVAFRFTGDPVQIGLLVIDAIAIIVVLALINHVRRQAG